MVRTVGKLSPGITSADLLPYRPAPGPPPEWPPVNAPRQPQCGPNLREKQAPKRHPAGSAPLWAPRWLGFDVTLRRVGRYRDPAPVLKTGVSERAPWVRIPPSPLPGVLRMPCVLTKIARFPERMSPTSSHHRRPDEIRFPAEAAQLAGSAKLRRVSSMFCCLRRREPVGSLVNQLQSGARLGSELPRRGCLP